MRYRRFKKRSDGEGPDNLAAAASASLGFYRLKEAIGYLLASGSEFVLIFEPRSRVDDAPG
jgi:hypothetical protein